MSTHQYYELNEISNSDYYSLQNTTAHPYEKYFRAKISDYSWKKFLLLIYQRFLSSIVASFLLSLFIVANAIVIVICEVVIYPKNSNFNHDIPRVYQVTQLSVKKQTLALKCDSFFFASDRETQSKIDRSRNTVVKIDKGTSHYYEEKWEIPNFSTYLLVRRDEVKWSFFYSIPFYVCCSLFFCNWLYRLIFAIVNQVENVVCVKEFTINNSFNRKADFNELYCYRGCSGKRGYATRRNKYTKHLW
ncbi:predicted protein [Naegleria gruberi]|uniref:Predicted protein n=1 Tax=Naegleria gruberi TaxID=5762 RepID=D2VWU5_NAEGR|nr:uncharacterized protein NAEGRDRAFT_73508 [Naegleria gruberi]EFC38754.1 predicted protein [Naegleria gruberi]|eukprot:XP_002671498.1 predicted protein [Naegleria gruberi strain NEG-M]